MVSWMAIALPVVGISIGITITTTPIQPTTTATTTIITSRTIATTTTTIGTLGTVGIGKMKTSLLALCIAFFVIPATAGERGAQFQNLDQMIQELNLRPYFSKSPKRQIKIAIFDNGFKGAQEEIGRSLPANTQIHPGPVALPGEEESHGFYMAKILWSLLSLGGTDERYLPAEFHLYNTFGYTNLKSAVEDASSRGVDLILYSQTWEYGGNFDGKGFINKLVNRAIDSGALWINNAGNFGAGTYNGSVKTGQDDWLALPDPNQSVEFRCQENPLGNCKVRAVLSWNSFSDDVEEGTDKDLDFVLTDDTLNVLQSSNLTQTKEGRDQPGFSKYSREILTAEVSPGLYYLRVKNRSKNFGSKDRFRITLSGDFVSMKRADKKESLLPPADNSRVITVGAMDSDRSSVSAARSKPELYTNSLVSITSTENFKGSSNSAAMVAAGVAILMSQSDSFSRSKLLNLSFPKGGAKVGKGLPLTELGFAPTDPSGCFRPLSPQGQPDHVIWAVNQGGVLVETNLGAKVFYDFDPNEFLQLPRRYRNDILVVSASGPGIYARSGVYQLPSSLTELVQVPFNQQICSDYVPLPSWARVFRLPAIR